MPTRLSVDKKRVSRSPSGPTTTQGPTVPLTRKAIFSSTHQRQEGGFYVTDTVSHRKFLIDTGAFKSIYPAGPDDRPDTKPDRVKLVAANGSKITTYGSRPVPLHISGRHFTWDFIIADVQTPLLGADFLAYHHLLVDVANRQLLDVDTYQTTPLASSPHHPTINSCSTETRGRFDHVYREYPSVFKPELHQTPGLAAKHGVFHYIKTTGPPVKAKFRRLSPEKLRAAKQAFADMEKMGLCRKAASAWASPLHLVPKPDGAWRPCGDYRRLNLQTEPDHYPLPNISDLTTQLDGAKVFSKLDLLKGYFQIPVNPDDVDKTAIITPFGSFVFHYFTFGLRNSGATFQRMMDQIFGELPFCAIYVDDILIYSKSEEQHQHHLRTVLQLLQDNGLVARPDKCIFGVSKVEFLGHEITASGVRPLPSKVAAIRDFPTPTTIRALQEFTGMVNYYHRFLPGIANKMAPIYEALTGNPKTLPWDDTLQRAFDDTKQALTDATTLSFPRPGAHLTLSTDASNVAVGAVIEQTVNGTTKPLGFFSRKLRPAERNYSTFDRELLAVHLAVRHFRHLLDGARFTIRTDHRPLVHAFTKAADAWSPRQQRQLSAIAEYGCEIEYLPGEKNPVADALSRIEINNTQLGIDYNAVADAQAADNEVPAYRSAITNLRWQDVLFGDNGRTIMCDVSTGRTRPYIPQALRRQVFDTIHGLSHPSGRSTAKLITQKFIWHGINRDVRHWARTCLPCQASKVSTHTESGIGHFPQPHRRFGHLHVDVVGPLPSSEGFQYLFTSTERSTRWPEAIPMTGATAQDCARALLDGWVSRFGVPDDITSDRGAAFTSRLWTALGQLMGSKVHHTTAYNPAANGMAERTHRTLKASLMARCTGPDWRAQLPWVLLGLRTTPKEGLNVSPAEMVFGETIAVPGEFFPISPSDDDTDAAAHLTDLRRTVGKYRPVTRTYNSDRPQRIPKSLQTCTHVFLRNDAHRQPLTRPYRGPYAIQERTKKAYRLTINGRSDWVSIDRLKLAFLEDNEPAPLTTTRSGRASRPPNRLDV